MRPPYAIELWDARGNAQVLNFAMSFEAAERVYNESVVKLCTREVIRVRDSAGALVLSSEPTSLPSKAPS